MTPEQRAALRDWVQIFAAVAVPLVVAVLGWMFQTSWKEREIGRDYVKLAADIVAAKDVPPALCDWASEIIRRPRRFRSWFPTRAAWRVHRSSLRTVPNRGSSRSGAPSRPRFGPEHGRNPRCPHRGPSACFYLVHPPGIEPGRLAARDFKSLASTNFAMGAAEHVAEAVGFEPTKV